MRIAYLISQYPAPSHTFIRREIEALRAAGIDVHTFSVRPPHASELACIDTEEHARTYYLLEHEADSRPRQRPGLRPRPASLPADVLGRAPPPRRREPRRALVDLPLR